MSKISVIVPVYNVEVYLKDCISSVIQQTYKEFELILIDDGSTDKSGEICDQYSMLNPDNVVVIHTDNQGPLPARILGIEKASGDILVFLDSDDCLRKDALEMLANCFQQQKCDMVLFDAGTCPDYSAKPIIHSFADGAIFENELKKDLYQKLIVKQIPNSVCLKAVRKDCAEFPERFSQFFTVKHGEDLLMSAHLITSCEKIVYLKQGLYHYRMRPGSAIHSFDPQRAESIKTVHTELEKYIDEWKMQELHAKHYAREVQGWIDCLTILMANRDQMTPADLRSTLLELSADEYFRKAYIQMDTGCLSKKDAVLSKWLYERKYGYIRLLCGAIQTGKKLRKAVRS